MPRKASIGHAESDLLRYVADRHPVSVRDVAQHLAETKGHTRTTALNGLERLRKKGYLTREKVEGVYLYSPSRPKPQLLASVVRDFVDGVLGGSLEPFMAFLTQESRLSDAKLQELQKLIRECEEQRQEEEQRREEQP